MFSFRKIDTPCTWVTLSNWKKKKKKKNENKIQLYK